MDRTDTVNEQWNIPTGTDVVGADGDKVGEVVAVQSHYIVVEKGFFFPSDYYVPVGAIANFDGDKVYLNVTKDQALNQGWEIAPAEREMPVEGTVPPQTAGTMPAQTAAAGYTADMGGTNATVAPGTTHEQPFAHRAGEVTHLDEGETLRVPVREEELTATRRPVERGEVEINKDVVAEERQLEVPVTEERVRVERRVMDRDVPEGATTFEEGTIEVPVRGEEVEVEKRVVQTGEVDVTKEPVQRTERVADTVRREEVHVEGTGTDLVENAAPAGEMPANPERMPEGGQNEPWVARGNAQPSRDLDVGARDNG